MVDETDGIDEAIESQVRTAAMVAAQIGQRMAWTIEQRAERARRANETEARQLAERLEAERRTALAHLSDVQRPQWWERATPEKIGNAYETAVAWEEREPAASAARQRIEDEVRTRYGIDPEELQARTRAEKERIEADREAGDAAVLLSEAATEDEREEAARERQDSSSENLAHDRAITARNEAQYAWDSSERRDATAAALEAQGHRPEHIATRMRADTAQALEPSAAATAAHRAPKARKASKRGLGRGKQGLER